VGRVNLNGIYDHFGHEIGQVDDDGVIRDGSGVVRGRVGRGEWILDYVIWDQRNAPVGQAKNAGTRGVFHVLDGSGNQVGMTNDDGMIFDRNGNQVGRIYGDLQTLAGAAGFLLLLQGNPRLHQATPYLGRGRWEYREFTASLGGVTVVDASAPVSDERILALVRRGVQALLSRHAADGWEPYEPLDARSLLLEGRVSYSERKRESLRKFFIHPTSSIALDCTLDAVTIPLRRWVA
jgi:hypothetical protein